MTIEYQGRVLTVEETGDDKEPYRLVGTRGGALSLVRTGAPTRTLFWVRTADGRIDGGYVGLLDDGRLIWLPQSGPQAYPARQLYRQRAAWRAA